MKRAPGYLDKSGRKFWNETLKAFEMEDAHDLERLALACHALDRCAECRAEIDAEGPFFTDRFGQPKERPAMKSERDYSILFARLVRELCLDIEQPAESRPARNY